MSACTCIRRVIAANPYIAEGLTGRTVLTEHLYWHASNRYGVEWAAEYLNARAWAHSRETALLAAALLAATLLTAYALEGAASAALVYDKPNALLVVMSAWVWLQLRGHLDSGSSPE